MSDATPLQSFIENRIAQEYDNKHLLMKDTDEALILNNYVPHCCPFCGAKSFIKYGKTTTGINKYKCKECSKYFSITTGTIFQDHKIPISEWIEFCLTLFRFQSFNSISKTNRNAYTTTKYWLYKLFLILEGYQKDIVLKQKVYLDETFYKVRKGDLDYKEPGIKFRGLSHNQICIGSACDDVNVIAFVEGLGKPSQKNTFDAFATHIERNSVLIHDGEKSHNALIQNLELKSEKHPTSKLKGLEDKDNPLNKINKHCDRLKRFLNSHIYFY